MYYESVVCNAPENIVGAESRSMHHGECHISHAIPDPERAKDIDVLKP